MKASILTTAAALSDQDLVARIHVLAAREREAAAELIAHLAVLDTRPALYAVKGYEPYSVIALMHWGSPKMLRAIASQSPGPAGATR